MLVAPRTASLLVQDNIILIRQSIITVSLHLSIVEHALFFVSCYLPLRLWKKFATACTFSPTFTCNEGELTFCKHTSWCFESFQPLFSKILQGLVPLSWKKELLFKDRAGILPQSYPLAHFLRSLVLTLLQLEESVHLNMGNKTVHSTKSSIVKTFRVHLWHVAAAMLSKVPQVPHETEIRKVSIQYRAFTWCSLG